MSSVTQSITKEKKENGLLLHNLSKANIASNDKFLFRLCSLAQCPGLKYFKNIKPASRLCKKKKKNIKNFSHHLLCETLLCVTVGQERERRTKTGLKDAMRQMFDGIREYMVCGVLSSFQQNKLEQQSKQKTCFALYYLVSQIDGRHLKRKNIQRILGCIMQCSSRFCRLYKVRL